ncbi:MAG: ABC transporter permease [Pseudomonadota bacterium]
MRTILQIIRKEFLQLRRDRRMFPMLFLAPLIQVFIFGFAANNDVTHVPIALVDQDRSIESRRLVDEFLSSGYFDLAGSADSVPEVEPWLVRGKAQIILVIGKNFGRDLKSRRTPQVQVIADGSDASSATVGLGYASRILERLGTRLAPGHLQGLSMSRIELVPRVWYNPDLKSRWFYLPAILAMILILTTMILPSMAVVREKELGTLEQIIVTPIRPYQLMIGKLFPFAVIGIANICFMTAVIVFGFGVEIRGSFLLLLLLSFPFLLSTLGLGLFVSTLVRTQQQAMMLSMYGVMIPMVYLSGLIFPVENMPAAVQKFTYLIPLRYYATILRGVFLKGSGLETLWPEVLALLAVGLAVLALASARFRKNLD